MAEAESEDRPRCERCAGPVVPIVHGMPGEELWGAANHGELAIGGCMVYGDGRDPSWACRSCGFEFGTSAQDRERAGRIIELLMAEATPEDPEA